MIKATDTEQLKELRKQAKQTVDRFVQRFNESYRLLAYHAALPLVLTPELVNYLRNEFLRGEQVPWVAEIDLLLSDLCSQVGYELYAMDTHVRAYLLEQMELNSRLGRRRMQEVAQVLISYVGYLSRINPGRRQQEIEAQRWAAMVYLGNEQCKAAAREIAERLLETSSKAGSENLSRSGIRTELARLTRITKELSLPLREEESLLNYARLVQQILKNPKKVMPAEWHRSYQVANMELRLPDSILKILPDSGKIGSEFKLFFTFQVATIEKGLNTGKNISLKSDLVIKTETKQAEYYTEELGDGVGLDMILIPGGSFMMGSPEEEGYNSEKPQHQVTVSSFYVGCYPVTQAQWEVIVESDPSNFKEDYEGIDRWTRPVERVSWEEAKDFCARLSQKTGKEYRLPTEAEWEYVCRARTTTPFHFGETISTELANYDGNHTYGKGVEGIYRKGTTPVGYFKVANAFGLSDMHGNVWEWCEDDWHDNYENAPTNDKAWFLGNIDLKVVRGGSWKGEPGLSRSACRSSRYYIHRANDLGFRVVCSEVSLPLKLENLVRNEYELMQLYRLYEGEKQNRSLFFKKRKSFLAELRNLRTLGLIANKPDKTIGGMPRRGEDLRDYLYLTEKGLDYIEAREMYGLLNPRREKNPEFWKQARSRLSRNTKE